MSEKSTPSPYLAARREWEERYGDFVSTAKSWKVIAFISLAIAVIATTGAIYLAGQTKIIPYIVEVNKTGSVMHVQPISTGLAQNQAITRKVILSELTSFVGNFRNVALDARVQRRNIFNVYVFLRRNTPAFTKVSNYYEQHDPFKRARKTTVFAVVTNVLPLKNNAYQVEWREKVMDRQSGKTIKNNLYKMVAYIALAPPTTEAAIIKNPIGMIIKDLNWSKEM